MLQGCHALSEKRSASPKVDTLMMVEWLVECDPGIWLLAYQRIERVGEVGSKVNMGRL